MRKQKLLTFLAALIAIIMAASTGSAAELVLDDSFEIWHQTSGGTFNVSVYPGQASYSGFEGTVTGKFGDGTVKDYRFFTTYRISNTDIDVMESYADGGAGIVLPVPSPDKSTVNGGSENWPDVWTTSDPSGPADYTTRTLARAQNLTGTIDISNLKHGTVYFIHGTYVNWQRITVVMSGIGLEDITAEYYIANGPSSNIIRITNFNFISDGYDTITYTYNNGDADASRARFMGVIVDGVSPGEFEVISPKDEDLVAPGAVTLDWINMDPNDSIVPGNTEVYVDVLFGTDPENLQNIEGAFTSQTITGVPNVNQVVTDALDPGIYYWQVISYPFGKPTTHSGTLDYSLPAEPNAVASAVMMFTNDAAVESVTIDSAQVTWLGEPVGLTAIPVDDGQTPLTYTWSYTPDVSADPNITISLEQDTEDPSVAILTVTNAEPDGVMLPVTVTVEVADQTNPAISTSVVIDVYDDACLAAREAFGADSPADFDKDCKIGLSELAAIASDWLTDTEATAPVKL